MGLPHLFVALGAPGRAAPEESGSEPAAESGDLMASLRVKQPRRSGSQLWCSTDARAESRGLSKPLCKRCLPGSPRSGEDELRGSCISRSYQDVVTIGHFGRGCLSDPTGMLARKLCEAGPIVGRRAGLIRVEQAWAVPELVK